MLYNIVCAIGFVISLTTYFGLRKMKRGEKVLRAVSVALFVYKCYFYISENAKGNVYLPIEISSISYFLIPFMLTFKIKGLYGVGAFFGSIAGLGFFSAYGILGSVIGEGFTLKEIIIGCVCHGFLLISGFYLAENYKYEKKNSLRLWTAILAMLAWAFAFYDAGRGLTFVYFIIKPSFLWVFETPSLNAVVTILYFAALCVAYYFGTRAFYAVNAKLYERKLAREKVVVGEAENSAAA